MSVMGLTVASFIYKHFLGSMVVFFMFLGRTLPYLDDLD